MYFFWARLDYLHAISMENFILAVSTSYGVCLTRLDSRGFFVCIIKQKTDAELSPVLIL
jgi:hypothetical protein